MVKNKKSRRGKDDPGDGLGGYPLGWPSSQRWNPQYSVPRNSVDCEYPSSASPSRLEGGPDSPDHAKHFNQPRSMSYGRNTRDLDTHAAAQAGLRADDTEELSDLTHWLDTLAELYMNNLDNRARWDPRWLNITRRERFEGLASASVTVVDYLTSDPEPRREAITSKKQLAATLESRPENSDVRVVMVSDLSRFVMGALGQLYSIDPEFWYEHLVNSGYGASDSGLKLKNAVWMNWAERETRFRHRALPGVGQRTEWNLPRRTNKRCWAHLRWGRLGLLNYFGRKGFHEDEMETRVGDGRWVMERDVVLDKHGLLMTAKRKAEADRKAKKEAEKRSKKEQQVPLPPSLSPSPAGADTTSVRGKTTNVYRAYSTFESLPNNPTFWTNRDLRVMAPEGASYWRGLDHGGKTTIILLFDPMRSMMHYKTKETTPSLTFMPRAMEIEVYTEKRLWQTPDPGETYLDPPPPPFSKQELKKQKKEARKLQHKGKKSWLGKKLKRGADDEEETYVPSLDYDSTSSYTSDSEYDEEYQNAMRAQYSNPPPHRRERDYARKYALSTHDLVFRHMKTLTAAQILQDASLLPSILTRLSLDDLWQLLAEIRLNLDHLDADLAADLHLHLLESIGITTRLNINWMRSTLQDLQDCAAHLAALSTLLSHPADLAVELADLTTHLQTLQTRTEQTASLLVSSTGLAQSTLVIDQTSGIDKLTELAFFFVPLSFITSVFSMQVSELTTSPPPLWAWGVAITSVFLTTYLVRCTLRSPSLRVFAMHCRATMLNRFTSSKRGSASRRLNTVGNRAIGKFAFFFAAVLSLCMCAVLLFLAFIFLVFGGLWLGAAAAALYFIITRWPDPAVLGPGFAALVVAAAGMGVSWYWSDEIQDWAEVALERGAGWMLRVFPARWTLDRVDDDDLAQEGVNTYARQAMILAST
ncbi:hypothetical protein QBC33DRAFT_365 [Phialemonium atrogriseum]|uniref:Mg2+ transporter protein, CorA-like/Zinc transport protein ZntB n=1 Tax=Phialemonium atrogriseum TaxID=1093897 RepID=A0AAJ0FTG8_9PEZI|nr:uncharacterized protein QBC33DRAFT_365 [Phialemonium atrogriseum]KAK1772140.1 hypothetical protein QBC33DRAFT_365 [Phialemonium atrogriseum]